MEIAQKTYLQVEKDGKLVQLVIDPSLPIGLIFDALMELKGYCVERMVEAHKEEEATAEQQMGSSQPAEQNHDTQGEK